MNRLNTDLQKRGKQIGAIILTILMVGSMVGGYAFAGAASASPSSQTGQSGLDSVDSLSDVGSETQNDLGGGDVQPQLSDKPVNVTTTLQGISFTDFSHRKTGTGRYNISGVIEADPSYPLAPVGHPVSVELFVYEESGDMVAHDEANINLNPGSAHPYKLNVSGMGIIQLEKAAQNNTNPKNMRINSTDFDSDGTDEYVVVNDDGNAVVTQGGGYIIGNNNTTVQSVRDPYTSELGFNLELGKNENYEYELYVTAVDGPSDYSSGDDPTSASITPRVRDTISVSSPASTTSISSFYNIRTTTDYRDASDVTYITSYKSTRLQNQKEIYEELGLPVRGGYKDNPVGPAGTVRGFAEATSTNGEFAKFLPAENNRLRITTSAKSVPSNEPQTLVIRYVAPGDGNITVVPIDSAGAPIGHGRYNDKKLDEIGYRLPEDPTTETYTAGANNKTNIAVIQLSQEEQEQLNKFGEFFLSYENNVSTSDEFRLYCQSVVTGTIDRNTSACGLGLDSSAVDDYNNGLITDMSVYPAYPASFNGNFIRDNTVVNGFDPSVSDDSNHVYFEVTVKNSGTEPITNEPVNFFENRDVDFDRQDSATESGFSSFPISRTFTLEDGGTGFQGEDVELTTDLDSGDGTVIVNVTNGVGDSQEFVYDGHRGEITERLDGMNRSDTYNVQIETEMRTGQRSPEVNSVTLNAREVGSAANRTQTVSLDPGQSKTIRFPASTSNTIDPTDYTLNDIQLEYNAHFYDDNASVIINTDVDIEDGECDPDCPEVGDSPRAVITGPDTIFRYVVGSETVRVGTSSVEAFECPDGSGSGNTCGTGSEWELVEENVGFSGGEQTSKTTEDRIPLSQDLLGSGVYSGNIKPLERGDVQDPYRNLPGDASEWSLEGYGILGVSDTQSITATDTYMENEYGSIEQAEAAGWQISETNVGEKIVGEEYDYFRAINSESAVSYDGETTIDRESDEWSRVTESQYQRGDYSRALTQTRTVAVETIISKEDPNKDSYADENWVKTNRIEYIVNRSYDAGYDEEYFWSSPGGDWEFNDTSIYPSSEGYRYTRPKINESYWLYEWERQEEREFRLHRKDVVQQENEWVRNFYNVEVSWSRSQSGTLHQYEGPKYGEDLEYGLATGTFSGEKSQPAYTFGSITDYDWTINGRSVNRGATTYDFSTGDKTVLTSSPSGSYSKSKTFNLSNHVNTDEVNYQPSELTLNFDVDDNDEGRLVIEVHSNESNVSSVHSIDGGDIPSDGQISLNLADDMNIPMYVENFTVTMHGLSPAGYDIPEVRSVSLSGEANRGGSAISVARDGTGSIDIGLTVEDSAGYEDSTTKTVNVENCVRSSCYDDPAIVVTDFTRLADGKTGLANVQARIFGLGYDRDEFYVAELSPGDVGIGPSQSVTCRDGAEERTASEINSQYDSWIGLNESQVTEANNPYCVSTEERINFDEQGNRGLESIVTVSSTYGGAGQVKRVVWEGASTPGGGTKISFNINPRNNDIIDYGENEFRLELRQLGASSPETTDSFNVFFCHALNEGGEEVENKLPINRETRQEGGIMCPNLNSDFDNFSDDVTYDGTTYLDGTPARDGVDACPYSPGKQEHAVIIGSGDDVERDCESQVVPGELGLVWSNFSNPQTASEHVVYYDRYGEILNAPNANAYPSPTAFTLQLGYNPRNQSTFTENSLVAYYPMNEQKFEYVTYSDYIPEEYEYQSETFLCEQTFLISCPDDLDVQTYSVYNISYNTPGGQVTQNPAWELEQMDKGDLTTYPYDNLWIAADLSGNNYHAPIFHSPTRQTTKDAVLASHREYQYFYRGDERKTPIRGANGPLSTSSYGFGTEAFMMPFKWTGGNSYFANNYEQGEVTGRNKGYSNCDPNSESDCFFPRYKEHESPMNGPAFNEGLGDRVAQGSNDEFTISMYVKAGPNVGDNTNRNAWLSDMKDRKFFTFYHWNGKKFGWFDPGKSTRMIAIHAQNDAGYNFNSISSEHNGQFHYPRVRHGSHAWPNLPKMVQNPEQRPLQPTYSQGTGLNVKKILQNQLMTGQGYKSQNVPPEMKSLRMNHYSELRGADTGPGVGWKHITVTAKDGDEVMYYVDGLPYSFDVAQTAVDNSKYFSGNVNDEFSGLSGASLFHIVGAGMKKAHTKNFLNDYYISDYRMYDTAMTESQVQEHAVVSDGTYTTSQKTMLSSESLEQLTVQTSGDSSGSKQAVVQDMLDKTDPDNVTVSFSGELNGGKVTVTAYPLDSSGNRIDGGDQYVRATYNETQNVGNKTFFGEPRTDATVEDGLLLNFTEGVDNQYTQDCQNYKMTCMPPMETKLDKVAIWESQPLAEFVGTDILFALDNGTITAETAYDLARHYDDEQYYVVDYRGWFERPAYHSSASVVTLEDWNISRQQDFENAVEYERILVQDKNNTLDNSSLGISDRWEIVVEIEARDHTHQTPTIRDVGIYTYDADDDITECDNDIYRCQTE